MSLRLTKPVLAFAIALLLFCCLPQVEAEAKVHSPSRVVAANVRKKHPKPQSLRGYWGGVFVGARRLVY